MKILKKILLIVSELVFLFLILWFVLGYINFGKITEGEKPIYIVKEKSYQVADGSVKVYDNIIYKIVVHRSDKIKYSMKLWFMSDI